MAIPLGETVISGSVQCIDKDEESMFLPTKIPHTEADSTTVGLNRTNTASKSANSSTKEGRGMCSGRALVVGEGCYNLIYAIDRSKSMNATSFNSSLEFVGRSVTLFDIDRGQAKVALFTYDDRLYIQFKLGQITNTEGIVQAIHNSATSYFRGSAATRPVLLQIEKEIHKRRNDSCRTAIFILTSDDKEMCAGDGMDVADRIKAIPNVAIYVITFRKSILRWDIHRSLASNKDYVIVVSNAGEIRKAVEAAHTMKIGNMIVLLKPVKLFWLYCVIN